MQEAQAATVIVVLIISLAIFLVCREVVCWYFKINALNAKLDTTNKTLADIRDLLAAASPPPAAMANAAPLPTALKGLSAPPAKPTNIP